MIGVIIEHHFYDKMAQLLQLQSLWQIVEVLCKI